MSDLAIPTHSEPHAVSDRSQFARLSGWTVITLLAAVLVVAVVVAASRCHPPASSRLSPPAPPRWLSSTARRYLRRNLRVHSQAAETGRRDEFCCTRSAHEVDGGRQPEAVGTDEMALCLTVHGRYPKCSRKRPPTTLPPLLFCSLFKEGRSHRDTFSHTRSTKISMPHPCGSQKYVRDVIEYDVRDG